MRTPLAQIFWLGAILLALPSARAADLNLNSAGAPYAPLEVRKEDNNARLSSEDREDVIKEFKGLVAMGLRPFNYERWNGRPMSDCMTPESRSDRWAYRCEIITAQCNGYYYFYPNESRQATTLQEVEVKIHAAEPKLVDELKWPLRSLFGRESVLEPHAVGVAAKGPVRHWNTGRDIADLFLDVSENPAGLVRFVWKRSPLVSGQQVNAKGGMRSAE